MTIAEQLMDRIFDTAIDGAIDVGVDFYTVLEHAESLKRYDAILDQYREEPDHAASL